MNTVDWMLIAALAIYDIVSYVLELRHEEIRKQVERDRRNLGRNA